MAFQRNILVIILFFLSFLIWKQWVSDHEPKPVVTSQLSNQSNTNDKNTQIITINTDVLSLKINTLGADVQEAYLLKYAKKLNSNEPFQLLSSKDDFIYVAESGLTGLNGPDHPRNGSRPIYTADALTYTLADDQDELTVPLTFVKDGVTYTKKYTLKRGQYAIEVSYDVENNSSKVIEVELYGQLKQTIALPDSVASEGGSGLGMSSFRGTAYSSSEKNYKKYSFDDVKDGNLSINTSNGWVAMLQHYFASAWVPSQNQQNVFYTKATANKTQAIIGFKSEKLLINAGEKEALGAKLWLGPELQDQLKATAKHLDLIVDYGWLWFLSQPLFQLLKFIQGIVSNWGFAVIIITFIVRGILFPLTRAQYRSMAKMKLLQPQLQALKERYGDDRQKIGQETMALYRKEKVNPLGGCFPILIQMPIFLSLFYMLSSSVELRHAPFMFWIQDLSAQDPYYIFPILMGISMFLIQKMSPTAVADPMQQKLMTFMPVIFTVFFLWFPSGLVLYYIVSNLFTIVQQRVIYNELERKGLHERKPKK